MAHFARLDDSNIVTNVIVIGNDDIIKTPQAWWDPFKLFTGKESEEVGIALCRSICEDPDSKWVQTSWNARNGEGFRGNYAGIGMTYMTNVKTLGVESTDIFVRQQPYDSWSIGISTADWFPPNGVEPIANYDLSNEHAKICANALVNAELVGAPSHGAARVVSYCNRIKKKVINNLK